MFNPVPVVLADLRRTRLGVLAIMLLIALAVALGVAVSAQERALREGSARAADAFDLIIGAPGSETQLVLSSVFLQPASLELMDGTVLADLANDERVAFVAPVGFGDSYRGYPIIGTTDDFVARAAGGLSEGHPFRSLFQVVIGADVDLPLGARFSPVHGHVVIEGDEQAHTALTYEIAGRLKRQGNPWDRAILAPIEAVWWVHGLPTGHDPASHNITTEADAIKTPLGAPWDRDFLPGVPALIVKPASFAAAYSLRADYRSTSTQAVFPAEVLVQLYGLLGDVRDLLAVMSMMTQVLVIGAVLLAVLATVALRRRMIGVLRALGASRGYIFATIWLNVSLMTSAGACLGLLLGWGGAWGLSALFSQRTGILLPVSLSTPELLLTGLIIVIGWAMAALPALLAYRQPVAQALRG